MVREAEANAGADKERKKEVETRNNADSLIYATEKTLRENGESVGADDKTKIEAAIADLRKSLEGSSVSDIEAKMNNLTQASHKLAEAMYAKAQAAGGGAGPEDFAGGAGGPTGGASAGPEYVNPGGNGGNAAPGGGGSTVDADFKVVDDDK